MIERTENTQDQAPLNARTPRERRARRAGWLAAAAAASLLVATPVLAHGGAWGLGGNAGSAAVPTHPMGAYHGSMMQPGFGMQPGYGMQPGFGGRGVAGQQPGVRGMPGFGSRAAGPAGAMLPGMLQRLPLGTELTVSVYAADPAEGADATATLSAVVGETSEVAFAQEVQAASEGAAYLTIEVGPRTERIDLTATGVRAPMGGLVAGHAALELGDTIEVAVFATADATDPATTLNFTYGEDSEAAFRADLADATAGAAAIEVTHPATTRTIDLSATPFGAGAYGPGAYGPGMGRQDGGFARPDGMPGYGMPGRSTR